MKLSLLVPVYNERVYLAEVFKRIALCPLPSGGQIKEIEVVVVDDCSTDGTREWLKTRLSQYESLRKDGVKVGMKLLLQEKNRGKGNAIQRAIRESTGDIVLVQDADLEYSPVDYPKLLQPIVDGIADAVFGSRFLGETRRVLFFWHSVINRILTTISNMATDLNLTDMETCYKAVTGPMARSMRLTSRRFGVEPEITARLSQLRARVYEVPVSYHGRTYNEGKKIGMSDGIAALWFVLKYNYFDKQPLREDSDEKSLILLSDDSAGFSIPHLKRALQQAGLDKRTDLKILEVGSSLGTITQTLLRYGSVTATDSSDQHVDYLQRRFSFAEGFQVLLWDGISPPASEIVCEKYDLIVATDAQASSQLRALLTPTGVLMDVATKSRKVVVVASS